MFPGEIVKESIQIVDFRRAQEPGSVVYNLQGDNVPILALDLDRSFENDRGTYLCDYAGTLADKVHVAPGAKVRSHANEALAIFLRIRIQG